MTWWKRKPSPETEAADMQGAHLDRVRERRKSALERLKQKLEELPIDNALDALGKDISGERR